jgi:RNA recognition motif-containing protein
MKVKEVYRGKLTYLEDEIGQEASKEDLEIEIFFPRKIEDRRHWHRKNRIRQRNQPNSQAEKKGLKMKIYVGNLSYEATEDDLKAAFGRFGEVTSASIIRDKFTDRSKGFGFVEMTVRSDGEKAIKELDGTPLKGRDIKVNEARPREERPARRPGRY